MKTILFLLIIIFSNILLFAQPSFTTIPGTDGLSKATAYQIWTKEHLMELGDSINNAYYPNYSTWHFDKHFCLMQDINDSLTHSIGGGFKGHFHGSGKKITIERNYIYNPYEAPAIFGGLDLEGTIDSLTIDGYCENCMSVITDYNHSSSKITNCINNATANTYSFGSMSFQNIGGTISNCINNGDITGVDNVGGIAGQNIGSGQITNCINTGKITATNSGSELTGGGDYIWGVGGIAASTGGNILNCINLGTVEGQRNVGGIVGMASGSIHFPPLSIINCVNYGYIKGTNAVGGIVGISYNNIPIISNCVNAGVVEGDSDVGSITGKE